MTATTRRAAAHNSKEETKDAVATESHVSSTTSKKTEQDGSENGKDGAGTKRKEPPSSSQGGGEAEAPKAKEMKKAEQTTLDEFTDQTKQEEKASAGNKEAGEKDEEQASPAPPPTNSEGAVEESKERKDAMPSAILEKGIIYFFVRGRVSVDEPQGVQDIARTYFVLRPLPQGAKLGEGPIDELHNARLCALPKKVFPRSNKDVFMAFVETAGATVAELKTGFMEGSTYSTQTTGVRHSPNVTPVGEGVYAITGSEGASHLAYMLTIPSTPGNVQSALGLKPKGSFVVSAKNPQRASSNPNASLPQSAEFPKDILQQFSGRAWMPLQPRLLDYPNAQFLLIGDGHGDLGKAVETADADDGKAPAEEMDKLQGEDQERVQALGEDHAVFADLGVSKKEYPEVQTTW